MVGSQPFSAGAYEVLSAYNRFRLETVWAEEYERTRGDIPRPLSARGENLLTCQRAHEMAEERGVDPETWVRVAFEAREWKDPPRISVLASHIMEERFAQGAQSVDMAYRQAEAEHIPVVEWRIGEGPIDQTAERIRARHRDDPVACLALRDVHYGFEPRSPTCQSCPVADRCKTQQ